MFIGNRVKFCIAAVFVQKILYDINEVTFLDLILIIIYNVTSTYLIIASRVETSVQKPRRQYGVWLRRPAIGMLNHSWIAVPNIAIFSHAKRVLDCFWLYQTLLDYQLHPPSNFSRTLRSYGWYSALLVTYFIKIMTYNIKVVPIHNGVNYCYFKVDNSLIKLWMSSRFQSLI